MPHCPNTDDMTEIRPLDQCKASTVRLSSRLPIMLRASQNTMDMTLPSMLIVVGLQTSLTGEIKPLT
eukprot:647543-Amphidinium_carterae.1